MAALVDESKKILVLPRLGKDHTKILTFSYQPLLTTSDLLAC